MFWWLLWIEWGHRTKWRNCSADYPAVLAAENHLLVISARTLILVFIQMLNFSELLHKLSSYRNIQTGADPFHRQSNLDLLHKREISKLKSCSLLLRFWRGRCVFTWVERVGQWLLPWDDDTICRHSWFSKLCAFSMWQKYEKHDPNARVCYGPQNSYKWSKDVLNTIEFK